MTVMLHRGSCSLSVKKVLEIMKVCIYMALAQGPKDSSTTKRVLFFDHTHISFKPCPFSHQRGCVSSKVRGFLAVERAVSQVERTI